MTANRPARPMKPTTLPRSDGAEPDIIVLAFAVAEATAQLMARVRTFYYEVVLANHSCPRCTGHLQIISGYPRPDQNP